MLHRLIRVLQQEDGIKTAVSCQAFKSGCESKLQDSLDGIHFVGNKLEFNACAHFLRQSGNARSLCSGRRIHAHVLKTRHWPDLYFGNLLVDMYGKCGSLDDARFVFERMPHHNVFSWTVMLAGYTQSGSMDMAREVFGKMPEKDLVSWNSMIGAYVQHGEDQHALILFEEMQLSGIVPDRITLMSILLACASYCVPAEGRLVHARILERNLHLDVILGTTLLNMYGKCGSLIEARTVFEQVPVKNVVTWNAMIACYAQHDQIKEALVLFQQMRLEDLKPDNITLMSILSVCANNMAIDEGKQIHQYIASIGLECDTIVRTALLSMYAKCGSLDYARHLFDKMPEHNISSWSAIIAAYIQHANHKEAILLFEEMQLEGMKPEEATFTSMLSAYNSKDDLARAKIMHARVTTSKYGLVLIVGNALISMYDRCGCLESAEEVFDKACHRDVVTWNAMIAAYSFCGFVDEAFQMFLQMESDGLLPDKVTFLNVLGGCATTMALKEGRYVHTCIIQCKFDSDNAVVNALINLYGKCGVLDDAQLLFDYMSNRNVVSWNAMIGAYVQHGYGKDAIRLYQQMQQENIDVDKVTLLNVLCACATHGALTEGMQIHTSIVGSEFEIDTLIGTALINMYNKCGDILKARVAFDQIVEKSIISWTAIIAAYAHHGSGMEVRKLLQKMGLEGLVPDEVTFVSILSSCSHTGSISEGIHDFVLAARDYNVKLKLGIFHCIIDLLGRPGWLAEAEDFITSMPLLCNSVSWMTLLGSCVILVDPERGRRAAEQVFHLDPENATPYVVLSNIYAVAGRWEDAANLRWVLKAKGCKLQLGHNSIKLKSTVHDIFTGVATKTDMLHMYDQ